MAKILVVEDEKLLNDAYSMVLTSEGYDVSCAFDGHEALLNAKNFNPDLILLDLRMPKMGGIDFLKHYQQLSLSSPAKVIIFSNLDMQPEIDEAYNLGAIRYVLKAWASPRELVKIVNETVGPSKSTKKAV